MHNMHRTNMGINNKSFLNKLLSTWFRLDEKAFNFELLFWLNLNFVTLGVYFLKSDTYGQHHNMISRSLNVSTTTIRNRDAQTVDDKM